MTDLKSKSVCDSIGHTFFGKRSIRLHRKIWKGEFCSVLVSASTFLYYGYRWKSMEKSMFDIYTNLPIQNLEKGVLDHSLALR